MECLLLLWDAAVVGGRALELFSVLLYLCCGDDGIIWILGLV